MGRGPPRGGRAGRRGRVLVRASGTEPLVRVMVEAEAEDDAARHADALAGVVRAQPRRRDSLRRSGEPAPLLGSSHVRHRGLRRPRPRRFRSCSRASGGWSTGATTRPASPCSTDELSVVKRAGKLGELEAALAEREPLARARSGWAIRAGPPTARPPIATPTRTWTATGAIAVIHNGIIENFQTLRARLEKDGHALPPRPTPSASRT